MITYLKVRNLAIVEELEIEPGSGLNVITGETGAGKSLMIDSLEFLRGARGSTEMIRSGAEKMSAEAVIETNGKAEMIVKREIAANGRGRVAIDGSIFSVRELETSMEPLLEIHGQSDSHLRVAGQTYRELIDQYGGHDALLEQAGTAFRAWRDAAGELEDLTRAQKDRSLRLDLLKYQIDEVSAAKLQSNEEEELRAERSVLAHAQEMIESTAGAFAAIEENEDSALAQLTRAAHMLQPLAGEIEKIGSLSAELQEVVYRLQDTARTLASLSESVRHDPARLEAVEERLATIERLKKKYGGSVDAALQQLDNSKKEFDTLSDFESSVDKLQEIEQKNRTAYHSAAEKLSTARKKAARAFEPAVQSELRDLAMERTTIGVTIDQANDSETGF